MLFSNRTLRCKSAVKHPREHTFSSYTSETVCLSQRGWELQLATICLRHSKGRLKHVSLRLSHVTRMISTVGVASEKLMS